MAGAGETAKHAFHAEWSAALPLLRDAPIVIHLRGLRGANAPSIHCRNQKLACDHPMLLRFDLLFASVGEFRCSYTSFAFPQGYDSDVG